MGFISTVAHLYLRRVPVNWLASETNYELLAREIDQQSWGSFQFNYQKFLCQIGDWIETEDIDDKIQITNEGVDEEEEDYKYEGMDWLGKKFNNYIITANDIFRRDTPYSIFEEGCPIAMREYKNKITADFVKNTKCRFNNMFMGYNVPFVYIIVGGFGFDYNGSIFGRPRYNCPRKPFNFLIDVDCLKDFPIHHALLRCNEMEQIPNYPQHGTLRNILSAFKEVEHVLLYSDENE